METKRMVKLRKRAKYSWTYEEGGLGEFDTEHVDGQERTST